MSVEHLRSLLAIADSGSFVSAARSVYRTQSAISAQMRILEERAGMKLFDRSTRPPCLTDAGRRFVEQARSVVFAYDHLFAKGLPDLEGQLRLGVVPSLVTGILPRALVALRSRHAKLHIELITGLSADLLDQVRHSALDAAIINDLPGARNGLRSTPFIREPLVLIAPPEATFQAIEELIRAYPFIRYNRQAWVGKLVNRALKRQKLRVTEGLTLDTREAIITMVYHGLGVSIVPMPAANHHVGPPVRVVPLNGPAVYRVLCLVEPVDSPKSTLTATLLGELTAVLPQHRRIETPITT